MLCHKFRLMDNSKQLGDKTNNINEPDFEDVKF